MVAAPYENDQNYVNKRIHTIRTIHTIASWRHIEVMLV
jgi:hypothetical protein